MREREIIENLHPRDAQVIGYTVASEHIVSEHKEKEQLLQTLQQNKQISLQHEHSHDD